MLLTGWLSPFREGDAGMRNLLNRARNFVNLSPGERAILRFAEVLIAGAILAGVQAVLPLLANQNLGAINWQSVLHTFLAAFLLALYLGVSKYLKSFGDPPLPPMNTGA